MKTAVTVVIVLYENQIFILVPFFHHATSSLKFSMPSSSDVPSWIKKHWLFLSFKFDLYLLGTLSYTYSEHNPINCVFLRKLCSCEFTNKWLFFFFMEYRSMSYVDLFAIENGAWQYFFWGSKKLSHLSIRDDFSRKFFSLTNRFRSVHGCFHFTHSPRLQRTKDFLHSSFSTNDYFPLNFILVQSPILTTELSSDGNRVSKWLVSNCESVRWFVNSKSSGLIKFCKIM